MELNYKTRFNIGDEVWICQKQTCYLNCAACNGTGKIEIGKPIEVTINNSTYSIGNVVCPICNNNEYKVSFWEPEENEKFKKFEFIMYAPLKVRIRSTYVEYDSDIDKFNVSYETIDESKDCASIDSYDENRVFSSLEECQSKCNELNENNESLTKAKEHVYCG